MFFTSRVSKRTLWKIGFGMNHDRRWNSIFSAKMRILYGNRAQWEPDTMLEIDR
jgi:hypothetical protein